MFISIHAPNNEFGVRFGVLGCRLGPVVVDRSCSGSLTRIHRPPVGGPDGAAQVLLHGAQCAPALIQVPSLSLSRHLLLSP